MKKKLTKIVALVTCAILLVAGSIMGTVAYLTSQATVKNTFTYGNVAITMDDAQADVYGAAADPTNRATNPIEFKLIPGLTYKKNTTIHVASGSEPCYLFVKFSVDNKFANIVDGFALESGWTVLDEANGIYAYNTVANAGTNVLVLDEFTVKATATADLLQTNILDSVQIIAYAVQSAGFDSASAAWNAAKSSF